MNMFWRQVFMHRHWQLLLFQFWPALLWALQCLGVAEGPWTFIQHRNVLLFSYLAGTFMKKKKTFMLSVFLMDWVFGHDLPTGWLQVKENFSGSWRETNSGRTCLGPQVTDLCLFSLRKSRAGRHGPMAFIWEAHNSRAPSPAVSPERKWFQIF